MRGQVTGRQLDDVGDAVLSYAEVKALAIGNAPRHRTGGRPSRTRQARTARLTGYRAANTVGFVPKRLIGAGAVLAAVGLFFGAQRTTVLGLTGVALVLAGLYLIAFGVWSFKRGVLGALITATVTASSS